MFPFSYSNTSGSLGEREVGTRAGRASISTLFSRYFEFFHELEFYILNRLKFAMHILPAKPGNFSLKQVLVNRYFIIEWLCYIYKQFDCHFKLSVLLLKFEYRRYFLNSSISTIGLSCSRHQVSYPVFSLSNIHGLTHKYIYIYILVEIL